MDNSVLMKDTESGDHLDGTLQNKAGIRQHTTYSHEHLAQAPAFDKVKNDSRMVLIDTHAQYMRKMRMGRERPVVGEFRVSRAKIQIQKAF